MNDKRVVGVSYELGTLAPVVVLKGVREDADAILSAARRHDDLPILKDARLAEALYRTPIDEPVDKALFPVMARLLAHIIAVDRQIGEGKQ